MGWEAIYGHFDFDDIYNESVRTCPHGGTIVEVGVMFGRSLAYLAEVAAKDRPDIQIYGVDPWIVTDKVNPEGWGGWEQGDDLETLIQNKIAKAGGPFSWALSQLREHAPLALERCKILRLTSTEAARIFDIGSVHMAFIDGDHRFEAVRDDCLMWWPRIALGGFLAGHDWPSYESVRNAVADFASRQLPPLDVKLSRSSWIVRKCETEGVRGLGSVFRAMMNLRAATRLRLRGRAATPSRFQAIGDALDATAKTIERI